MPVVHCAVVGAGDMSGATPLISSLFHDEPSGQTLNRIGLEVNAVGPRHPILALQHGSQGPPRRC
jgi:2',3'-cyclic-nucleotide 2'-phosphodiesterase (5'-nucleotidase family)